VVLQRTLERTGPLREVYDGQIQFVHRTFRDFLAANDPGPAASPPALAR
jgi:hypothetical protein